jgi:hypothetical protein
MVLLMADGVWATPERVSSDFLSLAELAASSAMARNTISFGNGTRGDVTGGTGFQSDICSAAQLPAKIQGSAMNYSITSST